MSETAAPCGCCEGLSPQTPALISNRRGLSEIAYRVGRHASFKASLLAALSDSDYAPLGLLKTRRDDDFTIALLDAFAVTADILTFYQERLANESYLRTATQQRSVFELARLVGYRPSPGVAASAMLAVTLNNAAGAPDPATIPPGTRVQSVPALGQNAALFETSAELTARIEHNALPPQTTQPVDFSQVTTFLWLAGTSTGLKSGDAILFVDQSRFSDAGSQTWAWRTLTSVTPDPANERTLVQWAGALLQPTHRFLVASFHGIGLRPFPTFVPIFQSGSWVGVYALRRRASLFGVGAPDPNMLPAAIVVNIVGYTPPPPQFILLELKAAAAATSTRLPDWTFTANPAAGSGQVVLDALYALTPGLTPGASQTPPLDPSQFAWVVLTVAGQASLAAVTAVDEVAPVAFGLSAKATRLTLDNAAAASNAIPNTRAAIALVQSEPLAVAPQPLLPPAAGPYQYQAWMLTTVAGKSLSVVGGARLQGGQPVAVSGQRPRLQLQAAASFAPADTTLAMQPAAGDIFLLDAPPPDPATLPSPPGPISWSVLTLKGVAGTLSADPTEVMLLPADKSDPATGEIATLDAGGPSLTGTLATLTFTSPLAHIYDRATVAVNANVIAATHGQTVNEILGSGDSTTAGQQFQLKQSPLTFTPAASGQGAQSTLQVFVNDLRWTEVDNFLAAGPADRVYITRASQSGAMTVQFGDGQRGARPPSGQMNIRALYRVGIGLDGMVQAGQLSQPIDRPPGLKSAVNPEPATGGADPDTAAQARQSAPLHVLTLDRVVSLLDYQNFALAFAGIAKATAAWTWFGNTRGVVVTVAGVDNAPLASGGTLANLAAALQAAGNSFVPVRVVPCRTVLFSVGALLRIDTSQYQAAPVLAAVGAALTQAFGFTARAIGQGVAQSEVVATIQNVAGVLALELTEFAAEQQASGAPLDVDGLPAFLPANAPPSAPAPMPPAGALLLLDPASLVNLSLWQ